MDKRQNVGSVLYWDVLHVHLNEVYMKSYNVKYSCGCVHEIKEEHGLHKPTGVKKQQCKVHKKHG